MNNATSQVDGYLRKHKKWQAELAELRRIILDCQLTEEVKWRAPCYTLDGRNIVMIGSFKDCCVLSFVKGQLLRDPKKLLKKPGENTQSARVVRFTDVQQITAVEPVLKAYIREAVEAEKAGLKVHLKKTSQYVVPVELTHKFDRMPSLKTAFDALTPGRQRGYLLYFASAKQSKTRESRIDKCVPKILNGEGFYDEYLSKKMK